MKLMAQKTGMATGLLIIRLMVGYVFFFHGAQKLFGWFGGPGLQGATGLMETLGIPMPFISALMAGVTEFLGGLALIVGIAFPWVNIPLVFTMLVASFSAHSGFSAQSGGMEYPLTLALISAGLAFTGAGAYSADEKLFGKTQTQDHQKDA